MQGFRGDMSALATRITFAQGGEGIHGGYSRVYIGVIIGYILGL